MADQDQQESEQEYNERVLAEKRLWSGADSSIPNSSPQGVPSADKFANQKLQNILDGWKEALFIFVVPNFFIILFELFLPLWRPSWTLPLWRKVLYFVYIFLFIFLVMTVLGTFAYAYTKPGDFCELVLGGSWTKVLTWGTCTIFGGLFDILKPS